MVDDITHRVNEKSTLTGKVMASKSVIVIFAGESESDSIVRMNGSKTTQPITPDTTKYGSAKISNIVCH